MATRIELPSESKDFVKVPVGVPDGVDPTTLPVAMAFTTTDHHPTEGDWSLGSWVQEGLEWIARCLVGPGSSVGQLEAGEWVIWLRVTSDPEVPVRKVGRLLVF